MAPTIPKQIGKYEILELVGRGGMGVLYRAKDPVLERIVALKMMLVDFSSDQTAKERFEREAKAVARLQHRNVVTIHELGDVDGTPFIVMEFLSGKDLEERMKSGTPMTLAEKLDVVIQLCDGLGYAHEQGIVHRDIKPGNVRVLEDGTVKILDFGIAKFAMSSVTQSGTIMGTPSYMAPEQIMGKAVDGRADLFSAGVLLYEILAGKKPFQGDAPTTVVYQIMHVEPPPIHVEAPDLPEGLNDIVARALKKDADERYSRASEMASDLQMVKMMLDLPLNTDDQGSASKTGPLSAAKLYATTIGARPSTAVLATPMRGTPEAAAADAAARGAATAGRKGLLVGAAIAAVVILGVLGFFMMKDSGTSATTSSTTALGTGPASGTGNSGGATSPKGGGTTAVATGPTDVEISSVPTGAKIVLDGADTGKVTPATVTFSGKPAAVELALRGYLPFSGTLTDADAKTGKKEFKLQREAGPVKLSVSGPYPFELVQGSKVISQAAMRHDQVTVQPGGTVIARNSDYLLNMTLPVDFGRSSAELQVPGYGTLSVVSAVETCSVVVDGSDLGFPPIPPKRVASGAHSVVLKCGEGKDETRRVTVLAGERNEVKFGPR